MRKHLKWLGVLFSISLAVLLIAIAVDRLLLSLPCPPCHSYITRNLPTLDTSMEAGLVGIQISGMRFRARVAGLNKTDGDGVILLHGYPETSIMWEPTIKLLASKGFRVVAFDQRGYSPGARPGRIRAYTLDKLTGDVISVANAVGFDRFHLVGHDWGGMVGWTAAYRYPSRIATWTALSMPHPAALSESLSLGSDQLRRSSYILLNWIPRLAEFVLGFNQAAFLKRFSWGVMSASQREEYVKVFTEPGALQGPLNWYRANTFLTSPNVGKIRQPTLYIWGNHDKSLGRAGAEKTADYVKGPYRFIKLTASHHLMAERPEVVSREILSHLTNWRIKDLPRLQPTPKGGVVTTDNNCPASKPNCLTINVSPAGSVINFTNKCEKHYTGTIALRCTGWGKKASMYYTFSLGPGSSLIQENRGLKLGDCYYDQKVCLTVSGTSGDGN